MTAPVTLLFDGGTGNNIGVPAAVLDHYVSTPNSVDALYATFKQKGLFGQTKEIRIEAWGQLCFDDAAFKAVAYHMHNEKMVHGWSFVSWRCEMLGPLVGDLAKKSGDAPKDFDVYNYVSRR